MQELAIFLFVLSVSRYQKPYLSASDQLAQLVERGIIVTDRSQALGYLKQINYYRLSAYWYPFRAKNQSILQDHFKPDTYFQTVIDLYLFDKKLRLLTLDALESIEVALRTAVVFQIGQHDPWAYRDPMYLNGKFVKDGKHKQWLQQLDDKVKQSKETFVEHFQLKYPSSDIPVWIVVELLNFGSLSIFLSGMRHIDQCQITSQYSIPRPDLLVSWVRTLSFVRNVCAHHARLWNKLLVSQPKKLYPLEIKELDHLNSDTYKKFYFAACICLFLLKTIMPSSKWAEQLKTHVSTFPQSCHVSFFQSGFPSTWESEQLWN